MGKPYDPRAEMIIIEALPSFAEDEISVLTGLYDEEEYYLGVFDRLSLPDGLDKVLELKRYFCIAGLFTTFEVFLQRSLMMLYWPEATMLKCIRKMTFSKIKNEFKKIDLRIAAGDADWQTILGIQAVRNCTMHAGGRPDQERARELAYYGVQVVKSKMVFPERYFAQGVDAVTRTCTRIAHDCQNALREGRVPSKDPNVAGVMDLLLEQADGATYSEMSRKAQALADKLGHTTKWIEGQVKAHARYRDRSATGRWANLRFEEFEDLSGGRLIDKSRQNG